MVALNREKEPWERGRLVGKGIGFGLRCIELNGSIGLLEMRQLILKVRERLVEGEVRE